MLILGKHKFVIKPGVGFLAVPGLCSFQEVKIGQYFRLVNLDKKEYIDPRKLGGLAKLWEWCANNQCRIIPYLLRKSNEGGGGDIHGDEEHPNAGRWAGDRIVLVGDYDRSNFFDIARRKFKEISNEIAEEFNRFMQMDDLKVGKEKGAS